MAQLRFVPGAGSGSSGARSSAIAGVIGLRARFRRGRIVPSPCEPSTRNDEQTYPMNKSLFEIIKSSGAASRFAVASLFLAIPLSAQSVSSETGDVEAIELSPFMVTEELGKGYGTEKSLAGSGINQSIKDVPVHINVLNEQYLEDFVPTQLTDALRFGVSGVSLRGADGNNIFIRGFREGDTLRDGVPRNSYGKFPLYDVERVEVLKGPAGLLYGQVSGVGGIINVVTKQPRSTSSAEVRVSTDSEGSYQGVIDVTGALGKLGGGEVSHRTTLAVDSVQDSRDYGFRDTNYISNTLRWQIDESHRIDIVNSFTDTHYNLVYQVLDLNYDLWAPTGSFSTSQPWSYQDNDVITNQVSLQSYFNEYFQMKATFTRQENLDDRKQTLEGALDQTDGKTFTNTVFFHEQDDINHYLNLDFLNQVTTGAVDHRLLWGSALTFHSQDRKYRVQGQATTDLTASKADRILPEPSWDGTWQFDRESNRDQYEGYAQYQANLLEDRVILVAGTRFHKFHSFGLNNLASGGTTAGGQALDNGISRDTNSIWINRYGVVFEPLPSATIYYNYSESWEFNNYILFDGSLAKPSIGEQTEIGAKFDLIENRLQGTVSWFDLANTNQRTNLGPNIFAQEAEVTNEGVEIDLTYSTPVPAGRLDSMLAFYSGDARTAAGLQQEFVPDEQYSLFLKYNILEGELDGLYAGVSYLHMGDRPGPLDTRPERTYPSMGSYDVFNLLVGYRTERWSAQLNVENLTDKVYLSDGIFSYRVRAGDPRTFKLRMTYTF